MKAHAQWLCDNRARAAGRLCAAVAVTRVICWIPTWLPQAVSRWDHSRAAPELYQDCSEPDQNNDGQIFDCRLQPLKTLQKFLGQCLRLGIIRQSTARWREKPS